MKITEEFYKLDDGCYKKKGTKRKFFLKEPCLGCGDAYLYTAEQKNPQYCTIDCHNKNYVITTEHRSKISESHRGYVMPEDVRKKISDHHKGKSYCMQNIINYRKSHTLPKGEAAFNTLFGKYKKQANERGYLFEIEKEDFRNLVKQNCFYCGSEPKQFYKSGKHNGIFLYNGLDRVENEIGYRLDNVVPCCGKCNLAKRNVSLEDFCNWIQRINLNIEKIKFWGK